MIETALGSVALHSSAWFEVYGDRDAIYNR